MNRNSKNSFLVAAVLILSSEGFARTPKTTAQTAEITVRVYDYVKVPGRTLRGAKEAAAQVFRRFGLETAWLDCPLTEEQNTPDHPCNLSRGPRVVSLRIVPGSMTPKRFAAGIFGFAPISNKQDEFACFASLFFDRLRELADGRVHRRDIVLGHLMAHEIGHLLLGQDGHSASGIMRLPWGPKELKLAGRGKLLFNSGQATRMLANVAARMEAD